MDGCGMAGYDLTRLPANSSAHVLYRFVGGGHWVNNVVPYEPLSTSYVDSEKTEDVDSAANGVASAVIWPRLLAFLAHPGQSGTHSFNVG
jgi:hypothetical protein